MTLGTSHASPLDAEFGASMSHDEFFPIGLMGILRNSPITPAVRHPVLPKRVTVPGFICTAGNSHVPSVRAQCRRLIIIFNALHEIVEILPFFHISSLYCLSAFYRGSETVPTFFYLPVYVSAALAACTANVFATLFVAPYR